MVFGDAMLASAGPSVDALFMGGLNSVVQLLIDADEMLERFREPPVVAYGPGAVRYPWVWNIETQRYWEQQSFRQRSRGWSMRCRRSCVAQHLREELAERAFTLNDAQVGKKRLRFERLPAGSQRWTSAHEGAMHLGRGVIQGMRNWTGHESASVPTTR